MAKRKAISKKVRFEVFKRDSFKCQYCGATAPDVVLQVDHIKPVAKGGANEILNLVTSCASCNGGKGARELDDDSIIRQQKAQLLEMMLRWREAVSEISTMQIDAVASRWSQLLKENWHLTEVGRRDVEKLLKKFSVSDVLDAVDVAARQYVKYQDEKPTADSVDLAWSKVSGILRLKDTPEEERKLYYCRGIIRNRYGHKPPDWKTIQLLKAAYDAGAHPQDLIDLAKSCDSWRQFAHVLEADWGVEE